MSGAVSLGTMLAAGAGLAGGMLLTQMAKKPDIPKPAAPEKPPQAAQMPDEVARRAAASAAAGAAPSASSTMLTGPGGVSNDTLNLGKNVLLGGTK